MNSLSKNRHVYSWIAIILIIIGDCLALFGIRGDLIKWIPWICVTLVGLAVLWILGWLNNIKFGLKSMVLSKLLSNAIGPRWLSLAYLSLFVIHLGWLGNALMNLFSSNSLLEAMYSLVICVVVMFVLILFFPDGREQKDEECGQVFISGLSTMNTEMSKWPKEYDGLSLNIIPLVRIFQLLEYRPIKPQLVILISDAFKNNKETCETLKHIIGLVNPIASEHFDTLIDFKEKIKLFIREIGIREFPEKKELINSIEIDFTKPCSYFEDYDIAFGFLERKIKDLDDSKHQLYFNLTPGTVLISSIMTLMAIDSNRKLYYYSQKKMPNASKATEEEKEIFKFGLLQPIDKTKISIKSLVSQALETIND